MLYNSILDTIGHTPTVLLKNFSPNPAVKIYAKLEGQNPGGSVKDRIALQMIEDAEKSGELTHDKAILESTSGNTGIGLAFVATVKGYRVVLTMSAAMSEERKKVLRAFGAELIETDPAKGTAGAIDKAHEMHAAEPTKYWLSNQHNTTSNPKAHYEHTALEILEDVPGVTHFVAGMGTYGTISGVSRRFRELGRKIEIVAVEPVLGQPIQGLRNMNEANPPGIYDKKAKRNQSQAKKSSQTQQ